MVDFTFGPSDGVVPFVDVVDVKRLCEVTTEVVDVVEIEVGIEVTKSVDFLETVSVVFVVLVVGLIVVVIVEIMVVVVVVEVENVVVVVGVVVEEVEILVVLAFLGKDVVWVNLILLLPVVVCCDAFLCRVLELVIIGFKVDLKRGIISNGVGEVDAWEEDEG